MAIAIGLVARLLVGGMLLWASIKVVDRQNTQNTFAAAVGWAFMLALAGLMPLLGGVLGLVVFFMVCSRYYDLGILQSIGVLLVQIGIAVGLTVLLGGGARSH